MISGQTIAGKYRINALLGSGGMASVWSATNIFTERQFAIKLMLPTAARTPEAARRFLLEAKVSARVDHPNVIEIIDVGQTEDGSLFLVMELLNGRSLDAALRKRSETMKVAELVDMMAQVARALAATHKRNVIHRDLKPTNIFLHEDREGFAVPKVLDFGVSKFLEEEGNQALTLAGTVLGSPLYMSPEQAAGGAVDGRTDVFAFGAILFEALCGFRAYEAPNFNALIVSIATTQPRSIDASAPAMPEPLRAVVRDCMRTDRGERAASFERLAERLEALGPALPKDLRLPARKSVTVSPDDATTHANAGSIPSNTPPTPLKSTPPSLAKTGAHTRRSPERPEGGGYGAPWATPSPSMAASRGAGASGRSLVAYVAGGLALLLVGVVVGVLARSPQPMSASSRRLFVRDEPRVEEAQVVTPEAPAPSASVPVVSLDSLPVSTKPLPALERGQGRLLIGAGPGSCVAIIDNVPHGPTPLPPVDLAAGVHQLRCEGTNGRTRSVALTVRDGATARYRFNIE